jgi:hypothetical protein
MFLLFTVSKESRGYNQWAVELLVKGENIGIVKLTTHLNPGLKLRNANLHGVLLNEYTNNFPLTLCSSHSL